MHEYGYVMTSKYLVLSLSADKSLVFDRENERTLLVDGSFDEDAICAYEKEHIETDIISESLKPTLSTIVLSTTETCNLRCKYCSRFHRGYENIHMTEECMEILIQKCIKLAKHNNEKVVVQFHGGEPSLRLKNIDSVLSKFSLYDLNHLDLRIQTNGTLVNDYFIDFCKKYDVHVGLSFDGPPHLTDIVRQSPQIQNVSACVEKAIDVIKKNISRKHLSCLCVLSEINSEKAEEVFDYMIEKEIDDFSILPLYPDFSCIQTCKDIIPRDDQMFEFSKIIFDRWIERLKKGNKLCIPSFQIWIWNLLAGNSGQPITNTPCGQTQSMLFIDKDGGIYPCGPFSYHDETRLGNIQDTDFEDIQLTELYKKFATRSTNDVLECKECPLQGLCKGGCPANSYRKHSDIYQKDPFCNYWKSIISYIMKKISEDPEILKLIPEYTIRL